jgi:autotransporter translocation and assembly factor TamB
VLDVELGPQGQAQRVEAGTYLTSDLFLAFVHNLFVGPADNFNELIADYRISRALSLRLRYGDRLSGAAELFWEHDFRSAAQRRAGTSVPVEPNMPIEPIKPATPPRP